MNAEIRFFVEGDPQGQPRHRSAIIKTRKNGVPGARLHNYANTTKFFMRVVRAARAYAPQVPLKGPICLGMVFGFAAPDKAQGAAYADHSAKPDIDNLAKGVMDALTRAKIWQDDAQVCQIAACKRYVAKNPGVQISLEEKNHA